MQTTEGVNVNEIQKIEPTEEDKARTAAYDKIEKGWHDLIAAAALIQEGANALKPTKDSILAFNVERGINKHRPQKMQEHLDNLVNHRKAFGV